MADPAFVINTTTETFRNDVIEQSMSRPVVIDFWAGWCGPCRHLMPVLEKLATEFQGAFCLAKVNVDEYPEIAGAFGVQSIPYVVAVVQGQPVSQFQGVQSEGQVRAWLQSFVSSPASEAFRLGQDREAQDDLTGAETAYRKAVELEPGTAKFRIALGRVLLAMNRDQECREIIEELQQRGSLEPEAQVLAAQLQTRSKVEESGGVSEARKALAANPGDLNLKLKLAEACGADSLFEEACELCLEIIRADRAGVGVAAKDVMVGLLGVMGTKSRLAGEYRRRLATAFY